MSTRRLFSLAAITAVVVVGGALLASCGGGDDEGAGTTTTVETTETTVETTETTSTAPPTSETTTTEIQGPTVIRIIVMDGAPQGGIVRETVAKGERVVLVVRSDVADHVHLHGYDVMRDVGPGTTARLPFRATVPGRFEVELEDRGVQIADITVEP